LKHAEHLAAVGFVAVALLDDSSMLLSNSGSHAHRAGNDMTQELDELLSVDDVAALLKVSRSWVYERTRGRGARAAERLPHIKIGKYVRFDRRALNAFIEQCRRT
jgi:excisionase family DNA binding protein